MPEIPFTQYKLPDGRPVPVRIDRPNPIFERAEKIIAAGYRFECELLTTGDASFTIVAADEEMDIAIQTCPNGPDVPAAVDRLITDFLLPEQGGG